MVQAVTQTRVHVLVCNVQEDVQRVVIKQVVEQVLLTLVALIVAITVIHHVTKSVCKLVRRNVSNHVVKVIVKVPVLMNVRIVAMQEADPRLQIQAMDVDAAQDVVTIVDHVVANVIAIARLKLLRPEHVAEIVQVDAEPDAISRVTRHVNYSVIVDAALDVPDVVTHALLDA